MTRGEFCDVSEIEVDGGVSSDKELDSEGGPDVVLEGIGGAGRDSVSEIVEAADGRGGIIGLEGIGGIRTCGNIDSIGFISSTSLGLTCVSKRPKLLDGGRIEVTCEETRKLLADGGCGTILSIELLPALYVAAR